VWALRPVSRVASVLTCTAAVDSASALRRAENRSQPVVSEASSAFAKSFEKDVSIRRGRRGALCPCLRRRSFRKRSLEVDRWGSRDTDRSLRSCDWYWRKWKRGRRGVQRTLGSNLRLRSFGVRRVEIDGLARRQRRKCRRRGAACGRKWGRQGRPIARVAHRSGAVDQRLRLRVESSKAKGEAGGVFEDPLLERDDTPLAPDEWLTGGESQLESKHDPLRTWLSADEHNARSRECLELTREKLVLRGVRAGDADRDRRSRVFVHSASILHRRPLWRR
jgi:hypothetical protein